MEEYIYALCVVDSREDILVKEIIGLFKEESLACLKENIETNALDIHETCFDYVLIDKMPLNTIYPYPIERYIYKYVGCDTYQYIRTDYGKDCINLDKLI